VVQNWLCGLSPYEAAQRVRDVRRIGADALGSTTVLRRVAGDCGWTKVVPWEERRSSKRILNLNGSVDPLRSILDSLHSLSKRRLPPLLLLQLQFMGLNHVLPRTLQFHFTDKFIEPGLMQGKFSFYVLRLVPCLRKLPLSLPTFIRGSTRPLSLCAICHPCQQVPLPLCCEASMQYQVTQSPRNPQS